MSTPQNPYEPNNGSGDQNPDGQNPNGQQNGPGYSTGQNDGQAPQYGSSNDQNQQPYGSQPQYGQQAPQYGSNDQNQPPQYGSQPQYGQQTGGGAQGYDQNQYGQDQYGQNQGYDNNAQGYDQNGQGYDNNAQGYDQNQYGQNPYDQNQGYDANQYGSQPAYAGASGSSDQFIPANPNASYGASPQGNSSKNIWGILALIGGILGFILSFFFGIGFLFGAAGVIFAFVGLSAIKKGLANNKGLTITGMIISFVAILVSIVSLILTLVFGGMFISAIGKAADEQSSSAAPVQGPSDPGQDPSQGTGGSDGGEAPPVEGGEVGIGTDVTAAVSVASGTANEYASGAESSNGQIAIVTMTVKNNGSSDVDLTLASLTATDGGSKEYDDVFDGSKYKGSLAFADPIPAGGEKTYQLAFGVPSSEVDKLHVKLSLLDDLGKGKDFEFSKSA